MHQGARTRIYVYKKWRNDARDAIPASISLAQRGVEYIRNHSIPTSSNSETVHRVKIFVSPIWFHEKPGVSPWTKQKRFCRWSFRRHCVNPFLSRITLGFSPSSVAFPLYPARAADPHLPPRESAIQAQTSNVIPQHVRGREINRDET